MISDNMAQVFEKPEGFTAFMHWTAIGIELTGVLVIIFGAVLASILFARHWLEKTPFEDAYNAYRANIGRGILIGLEFLIAADIIGTVAIKPTWDNIGILAVIVAIRTFLSFTLEMEIHGKLPWAVNSKKNGK